MTWGCLSWCHLYCIAKAVTFVAAFILLLKKVNMTTREKVEGRLLYMSLHRPDVYPFFRFAYLTGIRVEDAYVDRWIDLIPPDAVMIQPSKHNNVRVIRDEEVYNYARNNIVRINEITHRMSRHTLKMMAHSYFKEAKPAFRVNSIASYIFRYLYVKKLLDDGYSATDIQENLGHTSLSTTLKYIVVAQALP